LPADYDGLMRRGEQALVAERSLVAFEAFKKASQLRPGVARPWLKLGWASLDVSRYGEAERSFERALSIDANLAEAQFGLAESLRFAGKKPEALAAYRAYVAMDPNGRDAGIARRVIEQLQ
jgi:tetratricopeptide (TPR) repeat protein